MIPIGAILGGVQLAAGLIQNANKEDPQQVQETAEMKAARARAREMAKSGFTPEEKAAFKQNLAATGNTAFRRAIDLGGGSLAAAIRAGINTQQLGAQNQFAGQDAQLKRSNIAQSNSLEQGYQALKNQQVAQQNQLAQQQNAAASQSINSGMGNIGSALNLSQALNYQPNAGMAGAQTPLSQTPLSQQPFSAGVPSMTPSGQVQPVGLGNYQIGSNANVAATNTNPFYNNLYNQDPYGLYFGGALGNYNIGAR